MKHLFLFTAAISVMILVGCSGTESMEADMDDYCACRHEMHLDDTKWKECAEIMVEITRKYEFDPDASDYIQQRIRECPYGN